MDYGKYITLTRSEYEELTRIKTAYEMIIRALCSTSRLNYAKDSLVFDDNDLDLILKIIAPDKYEESFHVLMEQSND